MEINVDTRSFTFWTDRGKLQAPLGNEHFNVAMESMSMFNRLRELAAEPPPVGEIVGQVYVSGIGRFNAAEKLIRIESIEDLERVDEDSDHEALAQLEYLLSLTDEDLDRMGKPASKEGIKFLREEGLPF